jgi:AraC-like DNA-binding protein
MNKKHFEINELANLIRDYAIDNYAMELTEQHILEHFKDHGVKRYFLRTYFKSVYNKTALQIHHETRMIAAGKLLLDNNSVKYVAFSLGYGSAESFSHAFRNYYKVPPSEYVESLKRKPNT